MQSEIPITLTLGKRKHEEAVETDAKKLRTDESNNGHTSDDIDKPTSDNQISSSDDIELKVDDVKYNDVPDGNCESSAIVTHANGDSNKDKDLTISQSTVDNEKILSKSDEMNKVEVSEKKDAEIIETNQIENIEESKINDVDNAECNNVIESSKIKESREKISAPNNSVAKPESTNDSSSQDEADDLLERLDAIDPAFLRKPDLKLEEIDKTDLEKDDLLIKLEEAANGDSDDVQDDCKENLSVIEKSVKEINEVDSIEQQLESLSDETVNTTEEPVDDETKKLIKENALSTIESVDAEISTTNELENDVEMIEDVDEPKLNNECLTDKPATFSKPEPSSHPAKLNDTVDAKRFNIPEIIAIQYEEDDKKENDSVDAKRIDKPEKNDTQSEEVDKEISNNTDKTEIEPELTITKQTIPSVEAVKDELKIDINTSVLNAEKPTSSKSVDLVEAILILDSGIYLFYYVKCFTLNNKLFGRVL